MILSSKKVIPLFCCQCSGRYSGKITHGTSVLWEVVEVMGVNRLDSKLGGATLPTFHTEHFNIAGSWRSYRKHLNTQIFLKLVEIVFRTILFPKTNKKDSS